MLTNMECQIDGDSKSQIDELESHYLLLILYKFECEYSFDVFIQYHNELLKHLH